MLRIYILALLALFIWGSGCNENETGAKKDGQNIENKNTETQSPPKAEEIGFVASTSGVRASGSYLSRDAEGRPVLCWSGSEEQEGGNYLAFARYKEESQQFGEVIKVTESVGMQAHGESMAKVAFRSDGSILAVFRFAAPTESNRFAGGIFYSQSFDDGQSWSPKKRLVEPETSQSQSFFDLVTLDNGEVAMCWLDGRKLTPEQNGSCLMFATTKGKEGVQAAKVLKSGVCQCCRTDLYVSRDGRLHLAYRDIFQDSIRDMAYFVSEDQGRTFSDPTAIYQDNWVIRGCPHTGPSLAWDGKTLANCWFTEGGEKGIYFVEQSAQGTARADRELISKDGFHPQMLALAEGGFAMAFEEFTEESPGVRIVLLTKNVKGQSKRLTLNQELAGTFPVLTQLANGDLLLAWTEEVGESSQIRVRVIKAHEITV